MVRQSPKWWSTTTDQSDFTVPPPIPSTHLSIWACSSARRRHTAKLVAALLTVAGVTAGLVESNGSLSPGLWLTSPAGWLLKTWISSGTIRSVIEYGLCLPFYPTSEKQPSQYKPKRRTYRLVPKLNTVNIHYKFYNNEQMMTSLEAYRLNFSKLHKRMTAARGIRVHLCQTGCRLVTLLNV